MIIDIILNIIKNVFTWPIVILIILLILLFKYHKSISTFIENIKSLKAGGIEVTQMQSGKNSYKESIKIFPDKEIEDRFEQIKNMERDSKEKDKALEEAKNIMISLAYNAKGYQFLYFDLFFVPNTKRVLQWFFYNIQPTKDYYKSFWKSLIPDENQLEIILSVLLSNKMLEDCGNSLVITELGKEFLRYENLIK